MIRGRRGLLPRADFNTALLQEDVWAEWISSLQCLVWALREYAKEKPPVGLVPQHLDAKSLASKSITAIKKAIAMSPGAPLAMKIDGASITLYPKGAKFLDDGLVNDTLGWLGAHQDARSYFEKALSLYLKDDKTQFRNLLDELRRAMEELLRSILGNDKSLENQKGSLGQWFKDRGIHDQVRNMYATLLSQFATYQNDAVKHGNDWNESEVEYMIYLTGTFMRMLLVLNGDSR